MSNGINYDIDMLIIALRAINNRYIHEDDLEELLLTVEVE